MLLAAVAPWLSASLETEGRRAIGEPTNTAREKGDLKEPAPGGEVENDADRR